MELKNYQKRVLRELDAYMSLLNSTQSLNAAYNKHWEQLGIAVGFSGLGIWLGKYPSGSKN